MGHVLWWCPKAREAWECSKLVLPKVDGAVLSFQDIMWKLLMDEVIGENHVVQTAIVAWALWHNRNEIRCGGVRKSRQVLFKWASNYLMEYRTAVAQNILAPSLPRLDATWCPPRGGHFKINVDGAVFSKKKAVGIGVVIRDDEGRLEATLSKKIPVRMGALEVEAKAFETGLLFAKDVGVRDVILEGDSLVVFNAFCNISTPPSSIAAVVQGIQDICGDFRGVGFSHVRRQGNIPAHILAKLASNIADFVAWIEEDPCCIIKAFIHDVSSNI